MQISRISVNFQAKPQKTLIKKAREAVKKDELCQYADSTPTGQDAARIAKEAEEKAKEEFRKTMEQYFPFGNIADKVSSERTAYPYISESSIM